MHHSLLDQALAGRGRTERHLRLEELAGLQCNRPKIGNTISLPKACYNNRLREFVKFSQGRESQAQNSAKMAFFTFFYSLSEPSLSGGTGGSSMSFAICSIDRQQLSQVRREMVAGRHFRENEAVAWSLGLLWRRHSREIGSTDAICDDRDVGQKSK
jgi:hypothetical protein